MFLIGGPPYCGTTLLTVMMNQEGVTCLNEPDFHDPDQSHNGLPVLQSRYPDVQFPERGGHEMAHAEAFELMTLCASLVGRDQLGFKFCGKTFVRFAALFQEAGLPAVAIVRDIRDALVRPLKSYINGEAGLVSQYRLVWENRSLFDTVIRYEDLVLDSESTLQAVSIALGFPLAERTSWNPEEISPAMMYPEERHSALKTGTVVRDRIDIWRKSGRCFSEATHHLAQEMGYPSP